MRQMSVGRMDQGGCTEAISASQYLPRRVLCVIYSVALPFLAWPAFKKAQSLFSLQKRHAIRLGRLLLPFFVKWKREWKNGLSESKISCSGAPPRAPNGSSTLGVRARKRKQPRRWRLCVGAHGRRRRAAVLLVSVVPRFDIELCLRVASSRQHPLARRDGRVCASPL